MLPQARPARVLDLRGPARAARIPLPEADALKSAAIATWRGRMVNEHESGAVFEGLAVQLEAAGLPSEIVAQCRAFAAEERQHGVLCGAVVESLGGEAVADVAPYPAYPAHEDAEPLEAALRNLLSIGCLSETVAVALIGAERLEMPEGPLLELLTRIYADEVGHSHFGWRVLDLLAPTLDDGLRERLADWLAVAFGHLEAHELAHLNVAAGTPPPLGASFGLCSGSDARELFYATVDEIIVPGLEQRGLRARDAWDRRRGPPMAAERRSG
jgi:hypothetical protein